MEAPKVIELEPMIEPPKKGSKLFVFFYIVFAIAFFGGIVLLSSWYFRNYVYNTDNTVNTSATPTSTNATDNLSLSVEQTISDQTQLTNIAFSGLGFLTGNTCSDSFFLPEMVSNFFGFQFFRDTKLSGQGYDADFITIAANNVLVILNDEQKNKILELVSTEKDLLNEYAHGRFTLMFAFRRLLENDLPEKTTSLDKQAVIQYSADLYKLDARISIERAKLFGEIIASLTTEQKNYLNGMVEGGFASWESLPDQLDKYNLPKEDKDLVISLSNEMLAWYAGDIEAGVYFSSEKQAAYFGGLYIKYAPKILNSEYIVDETIPNRFMSALTDIQRPILTGLLATQKTRLLQLVETRRQISTELRKTLSGEIIDETLITLLEREYGSYDGEISYLYAEAFVQIVDLMTSEQAEIFMQIRNLNDYPCTNSSAYLYLDKISIPTVENTDFLFK